MNSISFIFCTFFLLFPPLALSQACRNSCGSIPIRYPFGTGPGCGDPRFQNFVTCTYNYEQDRQQLVLKTNSGTYPVQAIDYSNQVIHINDQTMSTCSCMQPSKGFGLDWNAPFTFLENSVFVLLGCSVTSSPVFNNSFNSNFTKNNAPLCDASGAPICSQLYACPAVSGLNLPLYSPGSSCCVYSPVDLGPSFDMDLTTLQCTSYTSIDNFNYQQLDATKWKYGISLKYRFSVNNAYPLACMQCEKSNGVCGYTGSYNTFVCNCPSGFNTSTDCLFGASYWAHGFKNLPQIRTGNVIKSTIFSKRHLVELINVGCAFAGQKNRSAGLSAPSKTRHCVASPGIDESDGLRKTGKSYRREHPVFNGGEVFISSTKLLEFNCVCDRESDVITVGIIIKSY